MDVTVLGPQRRTDGARDAVAELIPTGLVAAVNAGWQERESADAELDAVLGGRLVNLRLFRRWQRLMENDPGYAVAEQRLTQALGERQELYALRLQHAMTALEEIRGRSQRPSAARMAALNDAAKAVCDLDRWHRNEVAAERTVFYAALRIGERPSVVAERAAIAADLDRCSGLVIAGGHVGVLLHLLHVFGLAWMMRPPVIAWSAGAMALSARVMLFHHQGPPGRRHPEAYADGLGLLPGVVPFPHARHRLHLQDRDQLAVLARRLVPGVAMITEEGSRVDVVDGARLPAGLCWIDPLGQLVVEGAEPRGR